MNRIILQHTRGSTKQDFINNRWFSWAEKEIYEDIWNESVGDTVIFIESGYIFAVAVIEKIEYDDESFPDYPLRYFWNDNIQFVNIPLADFNEVIGYKRNYTRIRYHPIKEEYINNGFEFLSNFLLKTYTENEDAIYQNDVQNAKYSDNTEDKPILKKRLFQKNEQLYYPRNPSIAKSALYKANFKCELNENHLSFINKSSNYNYTEAHHLIPLANYEHFDFHLDVFANIISLCPNCHKMIHLGCENDINIALDILYAKRISRLKKVNLNIELNELKYLYNSNR